jgi:hypothetical protein
VIPASDELSLLRVEEAVEVVAGGQIRILSRLSAAKHYFDSTMSDENVTHSDLIQKAMATSGRITACLSGL